MKKTITWCATAAIALMLFGGLASPAGAHAAYKYSNPDDESTVAQAPPEIWAEYTEPPTDASYMEVYDPCGAQVDNGDSRADPAQNRVYITMSSDRSGTFTVEWFVDSAVDAHSTRGTFTFTATEGEPCEGVVSEREETKREPRAAAKKQEGSDRSDGTTDPGDEEITRAAGGGNQAGRASERNEDRVGSGEGRGREATESVAVGGSGPIKAEEPGLFEDIPVGGLVLALAMAAAIGGAGGLIYAGIMGYNRS